MTPRPRRLAILTVPLIALSVACGGGFAVPLTPTPTTPPAIEVFPTVVSVHTPGALGTLPAAAGTATTPSAATAPPLAPTSTQPPAPTDTPAPGQPVTFDPPELVQGGSVVVFLNQAASSATVTFGGKQYPMLKDGNRWWAVIGAGAFAEPGLAPVTIAYRATPQSNSQSVAQSIQIVDRTFPVENITLDPNTASLLAPDIVQAEIARRAAVFAGYTAQRLWSGAFVKPADGVVTSIYGEGRSYNGGPITDYHKGTDFSGAIGDNVYAAAAGKVVFVAQLNVRGNTIVIDHGAGVMTAYHHLSEFLASEGQTVTPGQLIGKIGSTGLVTGPHLHWEVIVRGVEVDGQLWLAGREIGP